MQSEILTAMNELVKKDISDILQVNIPSWLTVGWIEGWFTIGQTLPAINESIQSYGPSIIILLTIGFTLFKIYRAYKHLKWAKKDRRSNNE